ncbi:mitochondrial genome maintenance exonuclease 1 [Nilaparvata lugens]|uniref:mitochondrial genome maintenance exonuclease 1 n=1 Tax=Nilaparvata lugens TaxID=108931 RepID=UPI00193D78D1|nr:mitochondrial genome maintenance exonuclease 1 [Nilaparvata lugens]
MFGSKSLLSCKRAGSLCLFYATKSKSTKNYAVIGVVKYNKENKSLFGDLLETRAQRRKTLKKEHEAATRDEKTHLKEKCEETTIKSALKTSRKQKPKSKSPKNSVSDESPSTAAKANDVGQLLGIGSGDSCVKSTEKRSERLNPVEVNAQNSKIDYDIIGKIAEVPQVTSLFPLINVNKSQLNYEDCVEPVINISYESLCKNVISSLPSVGKILSETMPAAAKAALERWKKNMIDQLGEEGFQKLNKENLGRGKLFHDYISRYLVGETFDDELPEKVHHYFKSLAAVFPHISEVKVVESHVAHPELNYCGFIDCVAKYDGTPVVIEWKLAEKPKPDIRSTYDAPLQMCAYLGALNYDNNYNFPVANGVVVAAYTDGSPANVFYLPEQKCLKYWESFQIRLQEYQKLKSVKLK